MKTLFLIPARGGSKGIPEKNIRLFAGKPLILHTLELARQFADDKDICISTDDQKIADTVAQAGYKIPFLRPASLASDTSGMHEVMLHALDFYAQRGQHFDNLVLLQPTSPFRQTSHLKEALNIWSEETDMIVSVKMTEANPYYVLFEENEAGFLRKSKEALFERRQDCPNVWQLNGAIYIIQTKSLRNSKMADFKKIKKFEMDALHSLDLDTELDWLIAETINQKYHIITPE
ncbi:MAG: acylneuraminate cytidylyltransferase family protein [Lentimicrobiaceae bacterium]|nr:acylneuraminate cytidylyltransferase family protein [Lentimicrobiaceae bacterium]